MIQIRSGVIDRHFDHAPPDLDHRRWRIGLWVMGGMVAIAPGQVTLADRRTQRSWQVDVAAFELAKVTVTQALYADVTGEWPSAAKGDRLPVESVSWWDAVRFCNELSKRDGLAPTYQIGDEDAKVYGTYRVLRGGGWFDESWSCRASVRRRSMMTYRIDDVGFRLARSI